MSETDQSLATKIRETLKTRKPIDEKLQTSESILARITDGIYRQPASALRELISNAYDADAKEVYILTDAPRFHEISVRDDGIGFSPESLAHMIHHIGGSAKRTSIGANMHIADENKNTHSTGGRKFIGKMGIGLFAVAQFTRHFLIITKKRGDKFRTVADITLGSNPNTSEAEHITKGQSRIWLEKSSEIEAQGTEIRLLDLLPRTKAELSSADRWARYDFENEDQEVTPAPPPCFHIGRMSQCDANEVLLQPKLPWDAGMSPAEKMITFVKRVRELASTDRDLVDLEAVCDNYLQTIWTLSLAAPVGYVNCSPFDDADSEGTLLYKIQNAAKGQATPIATNDRKTPRQLLGLQSPFRSQGDAFRVYFDGVELRRPIVFRNQPRTSNAVQTPMLFIGQCREEFPGKPLELSGGPLEFEAYVFWTPKVLPTQHQGVMIRVGDAAGTPFDRTFMGYQISEQTRLRQITAEIFVREGLDSAINLDRESFNYAHAHYQFLTKWLHSAIRQLTNRNKQVGRDKRGERLQDAGTKAKEGLHQKVGDLLRGQDIPEVQILDAHEYDTRAAKLREQGIMAFRRDAVMPPSSARRQTSQGQLSASLWEDKAIAIFQILESWGLLHSLSYEKQQELVRAILDVTLTEVDR